MLMTRITKGLMLTLSLAAATVVFTAGCAVTSKKENAGNYTREDERSKDEEIVTKVKAKMYKDAVVKGTQVDVQCLNGEVELSGVVDTPEARQRAGTIAQSTSGVVAVHNNLLLPTGR